MKKKKIGGMATFSGVLLRSNNKQVVTSKINNDIKIDVIQNSNENLIYKIPVLRGFLGLYIAIKSGIPYIVESTENIANNIVKEKITVSKFEIISAFIISFVIFILLWVSLPMVVSLILPINLRYIVQLIVKILIFGIYIKSIKKITYLNNLFEYHGAEHIVVNYYEDNVEEVNNIKSILDININKVKSYSRFHKRCGSNYIMYLVILSLLTTLLIPSNDILFKIILEVITFPILIGLAYELLNIFSYIPNKYINILKPFMYVQNITTKNPSDDKLFIGMCSLLEITTKHISISDYINQYIDKYVSNVEVNKNDILRLVSYALDIDKNKLYLDLNTMLLDVSKQYKIKNILDRYYINKEPLQYITGMQCFYKEEYIVNNNVLIPRSDSEILVQTAIKYINENDINKGLDMCTGSGAIGISIAKNCNLNNMLLVDISDNALDIAKKNIDKNDIKDKCSVIKSDMFKDIKDIKFDILISNPPYIKSEELFKLSDYVLKEPLIALNGGITGLDYYNIIFENSKDVLNINSYLLLEIGYDQKEDIINIIKNHKEFEYIECVKDIENRDRVVVCRFHQI